MKRADAEKLEDAVRSLSRDRYWKFIGWLSNACEGDLWEYLRPRSFPKEDEHGWRGGHLLRDMKGEC